MAFSSFYPDYTVGVGIAPTQLALTDFTVDREFHPAPKNDLVVVYYRVIHEFNARLSLKLIVWVWFLNHIAHQGVKITTNP
jgi:hypothetical protein